MFFLLHHSNFFLRITYIYIYIYDSHRFKDGTEIFYVLKVIINIKDQMNRSEPIFYESNNCQLYLYIVYLLIEIFFRISIYL